MIANCVVCGKEFLKKVNNQKICSKECTRKRKTALMNKYRREDPVKFRERDKKWRKVNSEKVRRWGREAYIKHLEKRKEYSRQYYQKHKSDFIERAKRRRALYGRFRGTKEAENDRKRALRYYYEVKASERFLSNNFIGTKGLSRAQIRRLGQRVLENQQFLQAVSN